MNWVIYLFQQLLSYSALSWVAFVAVAFMAARLGGLFGMFAGHLVIAALVIALDLHWVTTAMHAQDWQGTPDMDIIFMIGVIIRIILINSVLLAVTIPALRQWRRMRAVSGESHFA